MKKNQAFEWLNKFVSAILAGMMVLPPGLAYRVLAQSPVIRFSINQGDLSRSSVTNIGFNILTNYSLAPSGLSIINIPEGGLIPNTNLWVRYVNESNVYTVDFTNMSGGTLPDGNYTAAIVAAPKTNASGPRQSLVVPFHRYFGDRDGDRDVDFSDAYWFRNTWMTSSESERFDSRLDVDGNGFVAGSELTAFNKNYFTVLSPKPAVFAHLVWDDGDDFGDSVTSRPEMIGRLLMSSDRLELRGIVQFANQPAAPLTFNLSEELAIDGGFHLSASRLEQLAGGQLVPGQPYVLRLGATDGNQSIATTFEVPFTLATDCPLVEQSWIFDAASVLPGAGRTEGRAGLDDCSILLVEGDSFAVTAWRRINVPSNPGLLSITYQTPFFDGISTNRIKDAFEVALLDVGGRPMLPSIQGIHAPLYGASSGVRVLPAQPDVVFNHTDGEVPFSAPGVLLQLNQPGPGTNTLLVDLTTLPASSPVQLQLRLVNNDQDRNGRVRISDVAFKPFDPALNLAGSPSPAFSLLAEPRPILVPPASSTPRIDCDGGTLLLNGSTHRGSATILGATNANGLRAPDLTVASLGLGQRSVAGAALVQGHAKASGLVDLGQQTDETHIVFNGFTNISTLQLNGSAKTESTEDGTVMRLTSAFPGQSGSVFSGQRLKADAFSTYFRFKISVPGGAGVPGGAVSDCNNEPGADGLALVVQPISSGLGSNGGGIGYAGIPRSICVEFDTWCNSEANDPDSNHIGISLNGDSNHGPGSPFTTGIPTKLDDGTVQHAWVDYDGGVLEVRLSRSADRPLTPNLVRTINLGQTLGSTNAFVGFTSATGGSWGNHDILFWEYRQGFSPIGLATLNTIVAVSVNGNSVEALDLAGNFFSYIQINSGRNRFEVVATDNLGLSTTNTLEVIGTSCPEETSSVGPLPASILPVYERTSFRDDTRTLYADVRLLNHSAGAVRGPLYLGVRSISDPSVQPLAPDGVSGEGIPYYDFSSALEGGQLGPLQSSLSRTIAFRNPGRRQFTFDLVAYGPINRPPVVTTLPTLEAVVGRTYLYGFNAQDPDGDALSFALAQGPREMTVESGTGVLRWTPTVSDRGTHEVEVVVTDTRQASARQRFHVSVTSGGPNRPPIFTSRPVSIARSASAEPAVGVPIDLRRWLPAVQLFSDSQGPAQWTVTTNGTVAIQELNSDASILLSDELLAQDRVEGSFSVQSMNDDDFIGFVFGYRDAGHFYLFDWKQASQPDAAGFAQQGMSVKLVQVASPIREVDLWPTVSPDPTRVRPLYTNGIPYDDLREYRFALEHRPGEIKIDVFDVARLVSSIRLNDSTYAPGRFGFYNESQEGVRYSGFTRAPLAEPTYVYATSAVDPDADPLTFSLRTGPLGMQVDRRTGVIQWRPAYSQLGSHPVVVEVADGRGGVGVQEFMVCVLPPEDLDSTTVELPDLSVSSVDTSAIAFGSDDLRVSGRLSARIQNNGPGSTHAPFDLIVFEDRNRNQAFDRDIEFVLGEAHIPDMLLSGQTATVSVDLRGIVGFAGAPLWAFVDGANTVAETIETNNTRRATCQAIAQVGRFDPYVEWNKSRFSVFPESKQVMMTPAVMDLNGDGVPEIVFGTTESLGGGNVEVGVLRAVRGDSGNEVFTVTGAEHRINTAASIAVGDIDRDGQPEIIACDSSGSRLIAFENDGRFKWRSGIMDPVYWGGVAIADLEGDGWAEVVVGRHVLNGTNGTLRWAGSGGQGGGGQGPLSLVADVDLDGSPDIVAGNTIYRANGAVLYQNSSLRDGFCALGNFDGDAYPEIVLVTAGHVWLLEHTLAIKWGPVAIPGGGHGGPPAVGDVDGDGRVEIAVAGSSRVVVLGSDGTVKWARETQDGTSNMTGASMFDFDGDGNVELVYRDELFLRVYRGADGQVLYQIPMSSCTWHEYVLVADADGDGNAEIVAVANQNCGFGQQSGVYVIGDRNDTWVNTRRVWNQHTYHIDNVNEDGTIPLVEEKSWLTHSSYRRNQQTLPGGEFAAPDLVPSFARGVESGGSFTVSLRVGNGGSVAVAAGVAVSVYEGDPRKSAALLAVRRTVSRLEPGEFEELSIPFLSRPATNIWVVADDDGSGRGQVTECDEANNAYQTPLRVPATNRVPVVVSTPHLQAQEGARYSYDVESADGDLADPLVFSLWAGPMGMTIDGGSGLIGWTPGQGDQGAHPVQVVVTDSHGGRGYQMFTVTVSNVLNASPVFASSPPGTAVADRNLSYFASARDAEGDPLRFELLVKPEGMVVGPSSGLVTWRPGASQIGVHEVLLRVGDGRGGFALQTWQQVVSAPNSMPFIVTAPSTTLEVGQDWSYRVQALDPEEDAVVVSMTGSIPGGLRMEATPGLPGSSTMRWTPTVQQIGRHRLELVAVDPRGERAVQTVILEVLPTTANVAPEVVTTPRSRIRHGLAYAQPLQAQDANGDTLRFNLIDGPPGMVVLDSRTSFTDPRLASLPAALRPGSQSGLVLWQGSNTRVGTHPVIIEVADGRPGGEVLVTFDLAVVLGLSNSAPSIVSTPMTRATLGQIYAHQAEAFDAEGDLLTWSLGEGPQGMVMDPVSGQIRWLPGEDQVGLHRVTLTVSDDLLGSSTQSFQVEVGCANGQPQIVSTPSVTASVGRIYVYAPRAVDPEGDPLAWALVASGPAGLTVDRGTGLVRWIPTATQVGTHMVRLGVSDGRGGSHVQTYSIVVSDSAANRPPVLVGTAPRGVAAGLVYTYEFEATDADGDFLVAQLLAGPSGSRVDVQSSEAGRLRAQVVWASGQADLGDREFILSVRDARGGSAAQRFMVAVRTNRPPQIVSQPGTSVLAGSIYRYDVRAVDPDGDSLTFRLESGPPGARITELGQLTWTSDMASVGSVTNVVVVSDPFGAEARQRFTVSVSADTRPPVVGLEVGYNLVGEDGRRYVRAGTRVSLRVTAVDDVGVASRLLRVGNQFLPLNGDGGGTMEFPTTGIFEAVAEARDTSGNLGTAREQIVVIDPDGPNGGGGGGDVAIVIHSPTNTALVGRLAEIVATVTSTRPLTRYAIEYAELTSEVAALEIPVGDPRLVFRPLTNGVFLANTTNTGRRVLGRFDPTLLQNGGYLIRVSAYDVTGQGRQEGAVVEVAGNLKFGEFRMEFADLQIPVAGIPITVRRVYDSRDSGRVGDFGHGWSLALADGRLLETGKRQGAGFDESTMSVRTRVYLTGPDGRRNGYSLVPRFRAGGIFGAVFDMTFRSDPGVFDTLEADDPGGLSVLDDGSIGLAMFGGIIGYDPSAYRLKTRDGLVYHYEQPGGLKRVTDPNGNTLTFESDGIRHSSGQRISFVRDPLGRISQIIDPNGGVLRYEYDSAGDLRRFSDQGTNVTQYAYDVQRPHFLNQIIDPLGREALNLVYDAEGRLSLVLDASGNPIQQEFDLDRNVGTLTDARGNQTLIHFDDRGNETARIVPGISTNRFAYDQNNNLTNSVNARGFSTNFTYDTRGNVTSITDPLTNVTRIAYNELNKPIRVDNALGQILHLRYDTAGGLVEVINNTGSRTIVTRDAQGRVASLTDAAGQTTRFDYTDGCACGKPGKVINPDGSFRISEYDSFGNPTRTINEVGAETLSSYDETGKLLWTRDPLTNYTRYFYNGPLLTNVVDALGRSTRYGYDSLNRTNRIIDAEGGVVVLEYDENSNRTRVVDPVGNATTFVYDAANRLIRQVDPLGKTNFFAYDPEGNRIEARDRNGRKRTFRYDGANRMTNELWWEGTNVVRSIAFGFNELGVQTLAVDPAARYEYRYDALNRLERVLAQSAGVPDFTLLYTYTALGQVASVTDHWGARVSSAYDNRNRLATRTWSSTQPSAGVDPARVDFAYDASGNRLRTDRFADLAGTNRIGSTTNRYNQAGIVTNITHLGPARQVLAKYDYEFDPAYQIRKWTINNQPSELGYDRTGQLTNALNATLPDETFRFDPNGNRVGSQSGGNYAVGGNNQILFDGTNRYTYDAEGNMASRSNTATGVLTTYQWDHRNRLLAVLDRNPAGVVTQTVSFVYDAMNRRLAKTVATPQGTNVVRFLYNQDDSWADLDGANTVTARYLHGARIDELLARQRRSDGRGWYLTDHLGTIRDIANAAGAAVAHVDYSSFGQVIAVSNPRAGDRFLFTGRELDGEISLMFYRARYYYPSLGRFLSFDPIEFASNELNLYRYIRNVPNLGVDPSGNVSMFEYTIKGAAVGFVSGAATGGLSELIKGGDFKSVGSAAICAGGAGLFFGGALGYFNRYSQGYHWVVDHLVPIIGGAAIGALPNSFSMPAIFGYVYLQLMGIQDYESLKKFIKDKNFSCLEEF
jgi:RHS repeat-associated protein